MVCACVRLSAGLKQGSKLSVAVWGAVEASTALCVASAPALRPLIFRTSYFSRGSSRSRSHQIPQPNSTRGFTSKSRGGGTNTSQNPLRDSFELNNNGVKVTKIVQVTTVDVERGTSSGSSSESFLQLDPAKHSRPNDGLEGIDPRAMGYQAEVVGGRPPLNRSASQHSVSDVGMWGGSDVGKRNGGSEVGKRSAG